MKKGKNFAFIIIIILAVLAVLLGGYFMFFYSQKCMNKECFNSALSACKRAEFIKEADDASWLYKIAGRSNEECKVIVKMLQLKQGNIEMAVLEGKEMACYLAFGSVAEPQENINKCSGSLKEEMQKIIINRLHSYITENLGEIAGELNKVI